MEEPTYQHDNRPAAGAGQARTASRDSQAGENRLNGRKTGEQPAVNISASPTRPEITGGVFVYPHNSTPAPPFTSTCVFTRYKTNTVSSCMNTTVNPAEELPFTKITAPATKNTLQRFTFLWENRADGKRARCKRLMTVILLLTHILPPHNCISLYTLLFSYCG